MFLSLFAVILFISCSDDSTTSEDNGNSNLGEATIVVSGDVEGERSGLADFWSSNQAGTHLWDISMNDLNPQTFSFSFTWFSVQQIERPEAGTYTIDNSTLPTVTYTHVENEDFGNAVDYTNTVCPNETSTGGELVITSSTDEEIVGSFDVTLSNTDIDEMGNCVNNGTIQVTGDFTATDRASL